MIGGIPHNGKGPATVRPLPKTMYRGVPIIWVATLGEDVADPKNWLVSAVGEPVEFKTIAEKTPGAEPQ